MKRNVKINKQKSYLTSVPTFEGETIEERFRRMIENKEPIKDGAPLIYTERKEGVNPAYNIKTDRFDIAIEAMDKVTRSKEAKRSAKIIPIGGTESTHGEVDKNINTTE